MKPDQSNVIAALLVAVAMDSASASSMSVEIGGCHAASRTPSVSGTTIPGQKVQGVTIEEGRLYNFDLDDSGPGEPTRSPQIKVDDQEVDDTEVSGVPPGDGGDVYCSILRSAGSGTTAVTELGDCGIGMRGFLVERSGAVSLTFDFTKNQVSQLPQPLSHTQGENDAPTRSRFCFADPASPL